MPLRPPVRNYVALGGQAPARQALVPNGTPQLGMGPIYINQTTNNTALAPGGSYMNGA